MASPPSGHDALFVRQTYLRKRRARLIGSRRRVMVWVVLGAATVWLCTGAFVVFVLGS